ncbi:MAG: phage tail protein [Novosphingobium sp.]|nr:phage tail protein [Novosphingobium sp.]
MRAIVTPAALAPAALTELKHWLGITTAHDDAPLAALLRAALDVCEAFTGTAPLACECEDMLCATGAWQTLTARPVNAITGLFAIQGDDTRQPLDPHAYAIELDADGTGRVRVLNAGPARRIGTLVGGPLGGAVGALVGRQVDGALIGSPRREGPRLKELTATTSSYGAAIPRHFGKMRVPGSIIWATDLVEHSSTQGGGKNKPKVTTYSYTASFAVALASRPIEGIGRIWADGNLLRGAAGDLKAGGQMRLHTGRHDQPVDPLMAAIEGAGRCPAYRGIAYVVFEDLELGDFFNRIPALTFEVIADEGALTLQDLFADVVPDVEADLPMAGIQGYSCEGPLADTLQTLDPVMPMDCDGAGEVIVIGRSHGQSAPVALPEAAGSSSDGDFGKGAGYARHRAPPSSMPPEQLRYYDIDRDYQPGLQRAGGRAMGGQPRTIELPAALDAATARRLAIATARRADWDRDRLAWRTSELDPQVAPGATVSLPGLSGQWKVVEWEWRERGVELSLARVLPAAAARPPSSPTDPGRTNPPADEAVAATVLVALELPWDGNGNADTPAIFAALSSSGQHWQGAALFVDHGDGELDSLGVSGRTHAVMGTTENGLSAANPLFFDRHSTLTVTLTRTATMLADASPRQLWAGANRALVGNEIIQFGRAERLGPGRWKLSGLLRGRGGTESGTAGHAPGEPFVLLDERLVALDPAVIGLTPGAEIVALGRRDDEAVSSPMRLRGITQRPLSPVHPASGLMTDGSLRLRWIRRARGAWLWRDGVDVPLQEQTESYQVSFGTPAATVGNWVTTSPVLTLPPAIFAQLAAAAPDGRFSVRQIGSYAMSDPLLLSPLL